MMQDVSHMYQENEYRRQMRFYNLYRKALSHALDLKQFESFIDVGCSNGRLLENLKAHYPHLALKGLEGFEWGKQNAATEIKDCIEVRDLRQPIVGMDQAFSVVNSTEVGEHLQKEHEAIFLDNLARITKDILILSWSKHPGEQHFNPRTARYIQSQIKKRGFWIEKNATKRFRAELKSTVSPYGHQWWAETVTIYQKRRKTARRFYTIWGLRDVQIELGYSMFRASFQERFDSLKKKIKQLAVLGGGTIIRVSDGEFYFLRKKAVGSATPGRRGSTLSYDKIDIAPFRYGIFENDLISYHPEPRYRRKMLWYLVTRPLWLNRIFLRRLIRLGDWKVFSALKKYAQGVFENLYSPSIPHDAIYALIASRWIFREFSGQIGLIGNEHKMELVSELMKQPAYQAYLGTPSFTEYIGVPQKGAADYPEELMAKIGAQIQNSKAKIFLVGMGHAKTAILHRLKAYSDAVFIDIGTGMDAIAGCICQERPQFADWTNFRFKTYNYDKVDQMDYLYTGWNRDAYKTHWLN